VTNVGHSLVGLALGVGCMPRAWKPWRKAVLLASLAVIANLPDAPLPHWGHARYDVSHSVLTTLTLVLILGGLLGASATVRRRLGGWGVIACGAAAWLSHLVLDSFYSHGRGIAILWPVSGARLALPIPWFDRLEGGWALDAHSARVALVELAFYGAILVACLLVRRIVLARTDRLEGGPSRP
jgi:hypothetical protein